MEELNELQRKFEELSAAHDALLNYLSRKDPTFAKGIRAVGQDDNADGQDSDSVMAMKVVAFLNARHYMVFAGNKGKTHGHSWQLQAEADVHIMGESFVKFEDVDKHINILLAPYQRTTLNEIPPFTEVEPLTENIAVYFFNTLYDDLREIGVDLVKLTVWENPTKGIEITSKISNFFSSNSSSPAPPPASLSVIKGLANDEVAASEEIDDPADNFGTQLQAELEEELFSDMYSIDENGFDGIVVSLDTARTFTNADINEEQGQQQPDEQSEDSKVDSVDIKDDAEEIKVDFDSNPEVQNIDHSSKTKKAGKHKPEPPKKLFSQEEYSYRLWHLIIAVLAITGVAVAAYWPILNTAPGQFYPYGFDSWCHVLKAEFLAQQIKLGNYYPQLFSYWHNGVQPFRYWGPLTYYMIALISFLTKNVFTAINWYIFICALLGGLGWLTFAKRIGIVKATLAGMVWVIWLDYVKEAFRVGNYPRLLTIALLPILTEFFLRSIERKNYISSFFAVIIIIHLIVLSHAMIGAIYCVSLVVMGVILWLNNHIEFVGLVRGTFALGFGVLTSLWWLLPSLVGGGATGASNAATGGARFVPVMQAFSFYADPANYMGLSLLVAIAVFILGWRRYPSWARSIIVCGIFFIILCFPQFRMIQNALPLHYILWPLRFSSVWALAIILAALSLPVFNKDVKSKFGLALNIFMVLAVFVCLMYDSYHSLQVLGHSVSESMSYKYRAISANARPGDELPAESIESTKPIYPVLEKIPGWKVATLDNSTLGSSPTYRITMDSQKEQVFGWAWQGAQTEDNVMLLNTALDFTYYPFLFNRLLFMGGTDLLVLDKSVKNPQQFEQLAEEWGYHKNFRHGNLTLWHGLSKPYLIKYKPEGLAIGISASNYAIQFPGLEIGNSTEIDQYSLNQLKKYKVIVLAGAQWQAKSKAEELIRQYTSQGGRVVVDLTGSPEDVMSRQPEFLGVYGEPITSEKTLHIVSDKEEKDLDIFAYRSWRSIAPQPMDKHIWTFEHYGNNAVLVGVKKLNQGQSVYFVGANLAYHTFLTHDSVALQILQETIQLPLAGQQYEVVNLDRYDVKGNGYHLTYHSKQPFDAIIPLAALDGITVAIDNKPIHYNVFENLLSVKFPSGSHDVEIRITEAPIFKAGRYGSIAAVFLVLIWFVLYRRAKGSIIL